MTDEKQKSELREWVITLVWASVIAVIIRSFLFQPFNIPSGSMKPTLLVGDYLFVSKYSYGYSRHSLPFSPDLGAGRVWESPPQRGDVVVFKLPGDNRTDYIKRLIGLPGDEIMVIDGLLHINGVAVEREVLEPFIDHDAAGRDKPIRRYRETLPNGVSYETLDETDEGLADNVGPYRVPEGHYFMMGDNRDNSTDSRFMRHVGYVPKDNLVGPARVLFFSIDDRVPWWSVWRWPAAIRYSRLLKTVD